MTASEQKNSPPAVPPEQAVTGSVFSPGRVWVLAQSTFTQLVRMKTFYFLIVFALLISAVSNLDLLYTPEQKLRVLKDTSFGAMSIFSWLFAIAATAMLLPRDVEDRTLYTIISKPVPRLEYLIGKLLGVLLVIAVSLVAMHIFVSITLYVRGEALVAAMADELRGAPEISASDAESILAELRAQGLTWNLCWATLAIFMKAAIMASVTLLLSTVASSSLFTIMVSVVVFLIGHFHKMAVNFWEKETEGNVITRLLGKLLQPAIPDFQNFNVVDAIVRGETAGGGFMLQLGLLTGVYLVIYGLLAWIVFFDKEF